MTTPPFGYFGSKVRIAPQIVDLFPAHKGYIEPYCGSLSVLLAKRSIGFEVVNDIDGDLVHFWRVLRDRHDELVRACALTPHAHAEYDAAWPITDDVDDVERARRVWVKLAQGRGGALRATGWRHHKNPSGRTSTMPRTLMGYVDRMFEVVDRIREVSIECMPAVDFIDAYGRDPNTLVYADPPYLFETRSRTGIYRHEAGDEDSHRALAEALHRVAGPVVLSGYAHPLYDDELYADWDRHEIRAGTGQNAAAGWQERTEVLWSNRPFNRHASLPLAMP